MFTEHSIEKSPEFPAQRQQALQALARQIVAQALENPEMEALWALHYRSRRAECPLARIAGEIKGGEQAPEACPDADFFIAEILEANLKALKTAPGHKSDPALVALGETLAMIKNALPVQEGVGTYARRRALPEDYKRVLDMIDRQMLQKPLAHTVRDIGREYTDHIKEGAQAHPYAFTGLLAGCGAALSFMNANLGTQRNYINPEMVGIDFSRMDENGNFLMLEDVKAQEFSNVSFGCHNHLAPYIGEEAADFIQTTLGSFGIEHCSALMDLDIRAQNALQAGYDFIKIPYDAVMDLFVKNPLADYGTQDFQSSSFAQGYNAAAQSVSETVYMLNTVENITLHSIILAAAAVEGYRQSAPGGHEARETAGALQDFFHRSVHNRPLNYVLPVLATGLTAAHQGGMSSEALLIGAAAGAAGHGVHSLKRIWDRKAHVKVIFENARESLHEFAVLAREGGISDKIIAPVQKQWLSAKEKMALAGASLSASATIVFADVSGYAQTLESDLAQEAALRSSEMLGAATATTLIAGLFVPFNVVEDAAQHLVFGVAGWGIGYSAGGVARGAERIKTPGL
ncbi:MAG: hypothetical protein IT559_08745 [Alphaproteobacteria bacterium]|nr:hypothetical protein [Alphaproteobacteria bacterium]